MHIRVVNPYDQSVVAKVEVETGRVLDSKVDAARRAFEQWRAVPLPERAQRVRRALSYFHDHADDITRDITIQMGKPITQARAELRTFFERADHMLAIADATLSPEILPSPSGLVLRIEHEPHGVIYNIVPWNYPLLTAVNVVVPALVAGNTVLLKHSPLTPLIGRYFEAAFRQPGGSSLVTNLVTTNAQAARLIDDTRIDYVAFTGSVSTGKQVYLRAAARLLHVGLELGGKDPAYVAEDADLDVAAEGVVDGACYNAGQSCCAVERVYVHRTRYKEFLDRVRTVLDRYVLGDPMDERTTMGPLARRDALPFLEGQVRQASRLGAKILLGGRRVRDTPGNLFAPTLLADVPNRAKVMQEESFGPLVAVAPVAGDEDALGRMNDSRYGLTASVWTDDLGRVERLARRLHVGTVFQNRCDYLEPSLPWTGVRDSGVGVTLSRYGYYQLTNRRAVNLRTGTAAQQ